MHVFSSRKHFTKRVSKVVRAQVVHTELLGHSVYFNTAVTKQDILKILRVSSQKRLKTISYYHGNMK